MRKRLLLLFAAVFTASAVCAEESQVGGVKLLDRVLNDNKIIPRGVQNRVGTYKNCIHERKEQNKSDG